MKVRNILILVLLAIAGSVSGQKTDTIKIFNGNIITGEIKNLEHGLLTYKTDDIGTVQVKWDKVIQISSKQNYEIELDNGNLLYGSFRFSKEENKVILITGPVINEILLIRIIGITPLKNKFWARFDGSFDIGVNYTKSNELAQLNFGSNFRYDAKKITNTISYNGTFTAQKRNNPTRRQDFSYNFYYALKKKWDVGLVASLQQNSELGILLRLLGGGGAVNNFIQSNRDILKGTGGLVINQEWSDDNKSSSSNLEGLLALTYDRFKYDSPKIDLRSGINFFPSITDFGRIRTEFETNLKMEILKDLFWNLRIYFSNDNKPPDPAASKSDYGFTLSFGYTL
ncbi:DUF481 domain-containing protein [Bacteroidota bacterium]